MTQSKNAKIDADTAAKPFIKWVGGKTRLIPQLTALLPTNLREHKGIITKYVEPFIGGGSMLFHLAQNYPQLKKFYISDINFDIYYSYESVKRFPEHLVKKLDSLQTKFLALNPEDRKKTYYEILNNFNERIGVPILDYEENYVIRAMQFIFLNKTCFNGLFRVNKSGHFNVPLGKQKSLSLYNAQNIYAASKILQQVEIMRCDFLAIKGCVDINFDTFVYLDPPYKPINKTSNFTSYHASKFNDDEQVRLKDFYNYCNEFGASVMLSNSKQSNCNFFDEMYGKHYAIDIVKAPRSINSNGAKRKPIEEIVVRNYRIV